MEVSFGASRLKGRQKRLRVREPACIRVLWVAVEQFKHFVTLGLVSGSGLRAYRVWGLGAYIKDLAVSDEYDYEWLMVWGFGKFDGAFQPWPNPYKPHYLLSLTSGRLRF